MNRLRAVLRCCLVLLPLAAAAQQPVLTISTDIKPPSRQAFERLVEEAFRRAGCGLSVVANPSERSLQLADTGEVDGEGLRIGGLASQYPNLIEVPESFASVSFVAFAKDPAIRLNDGWASLGPYRVAFITGWKVFEGNALRARIVHRVDRVEQLFRMLDSGRIDLALYTRGEGIALARSMGLAVAPLSPALTEVDMFLYLHRRHEALAPRIARAVRDMKADGTQQRIISALWKEQGLPN